jgi:DNA-binding beta-propeller fold protein YncE
MSRPLVTAIWQPGRASILCVGAIVLAGTGAFPALGQPEVLPPNTTGDGGPATQAQVDGPMQAAVDRSGNLYIYQQANEWKGLHHESLTLGSIRRTDASTGKIETVTVACDPPWQKPRPECLASVISHLEVARTGQLLFTEPTSDRLREFDPTTHQFSVIVGDGNSGDGGPAFQASIRTPMGFTVDGDGNFFVSDSGNHRLRRIDGRTGLISTIAGTGQRGSAGDGGPALLASFNWPAGIAVDRNGDLYVADSGNNRIRRIDAKTKFIDTVAGGDMGPFRGDGGAAIRASIGIVQQIALDQRGNLFFLSAARICRIDHTSGILTTVAGGGQRGFSGEGGLATQALISPDGLAVDEMGDIFIAEYANGRVRRVGAKTGVITTVAGNGSPL